MREEVTIAIRIPMEGLTDELRLRHGLDKDVLESVRIDGDSLVVMFKRGAAPIPGALASKASHGRWKESPVLPRDAAPA